MKGNMIMNINLTERLDDFWVYPKLTNALDKRSYDDSFFDFLEEKEAQDKRKTNLYIHIPFCDSKCSFCPYYKSYNINSTEDIIKTYIDSFVIEMKKYSDTNFFDNKKISSVHFGGGNPFLLPIKYLYQLVEAIHNYFNIEHNDNWTIEGSINTIKSKTYLSELKKLGIVRASIGIQTLNSELRKELGIKSKLTEIYHGIDLFNDTGFDEYCIDLMYNLPNQTTDNFINDIIEVDKLNPYHIDIYNLALFPNTSLFNNVYKNKIFDILPSNERKIEMYCEADKWFNSNNYYNLTTNTYGKRQKEIHIGDKLYLNNCNVLGIGASSRGYISGHAYKNVCDIYEYIDEINQQNFPANLSKILTKEQDSNRRMVFFPILMKINKNDIPDSIDYTKQINLLIENKLVEWNEDNLCLTKKGKIWSGNISTLFMDNSSWNEYLQSFLFAERYKLNPYNEDKMGIY